MPEPDPMDEEKVLACLNRALALQHRSTLQFTFASASMFGLEVQALTDKLWEFGQAELADTKLLVEKICALGGDPATDVAPLSWSAAPADAVDALIEHEDETITALHEVIPHSGQEPRSEALEHLLEHLIMRKQNQFDWLRRARRAPG